MNLSESSFSVDKCLECKQVWETFQMFCNGVFLWKVLVIVDEWIL